MDVTLIPIRNNISILYVGFKGCECEFYLLLEWFYRLFEEQ